VALHGRLDLVEYQLALFSKHPGCAGVEFIYVLDDPTQTGEAQRLFVSIYERFLIPFKAVFADSHVGFAPTADVGLAHAKGGYVAFLRPEVFPGTFDWLERWRHGSRLIRGSWRSSQLLYANRQLPSGRLLYSKA
jgi:hypothetical protein